MDKKPLIILTGPTAVGKTALSIELAKRVQGEIISADSMQVYKGMDIGSDKIKESRMQGVKHHLIDVMEPFEEFNIVCFQKLAKEAMEEIYARNHIPIITGGTGFYIQSVLNDISFNDTRQDGSFRETLEKTSREDGGREKLFEMLKEKDPDSAALIHKNNVKRIIRALEYYEETGSPISGHNLEQREKESPYNFCYFVLNDEREKLYANIERRVDEMIKEGLLDEVKALKERKMTKDMVSMQGLGYKEILSYLSGEISLEQAVYLIKRDTRHFAKRQLTWFRREKDVIWVEKEYFHYSEEEILNFMMEKLKEKHIL